MSGYSNTSIVYTVIVSFLQGFFYGVASVLDSETTKAPHLDADFCSLACKLKFNRAKILLAFSPSMRSGTGSQMAVYTNQFSVLCLLQPSPMNAVPLCSQSLETNVKY